MNILKLEVGKIKQSIRDAIDAGYRHIDTALAYQGEPQVGAAVKEKIDEGVVKRAALFITSKLWNTYQRSDLVRNGLEKSLSNRGITYLDLYLLHWPLAFAVRKYQEGDFLFPRDANGKLNFSNASFVHTWTEMEKLVECDLVRSIGLSNFNRVECQPYLNQERLKEFCEAKGILMAAHTPHLGAPDRLIVPKDDPVLLEDSKVTEIAKKYGKSAAQILIKYQAQKGNIVIPKSFQRSHMNEDVDIFDFWLTEADM